MKKSLLKPVKPLSMSTRPLEGVFSSHATPISDVRSFNIGMGNDGCLYIRLNGEWDDDFRQTRIVPNFSYEPMEQVVVSVFEMLGVSFKSLLVGNTRFKNGGDKVTTRVTLNVDLLSKDSNIWTFNQSETDQEGTHVLHLILNLAIQAVRFLQEKS